jgi:pyridoxine 5-phosphate synthase
MRLYVNIDHVATVREARKADEPDPVRAAVLAELGGADGITVHLREDRRHIHDRDVELLLATVRTCVNLELAIDGSILQSAVRWRPFQATLVPEKREEITTEGGLRLEDRAERVETAISRLREAEIRTALFIDPIEATVERAAALGADAVELHTGEYANAASAAAAQERLEGLRRAARAARAAGLAVHAGHGLTYENVSPVAGIAELEELNIGHSVISRAVFTGLERAVAEMKSLLRGARRAE